MSIQTHPIQILLYLFTTIQFTIYNLKLNTT